MADLPTADEAFGSSLPTADEAFGADSGNSAEERKPRSDVDEVPAPKGKQNWLQHLFNPSGQVPSGHYNINHLPDPTASAASNAAQIAEAFPKGAVGAGELGLQMGTGLAGQVAGGARGIFDLATGQGIDKAGTDVQNTASALTYQPRTQAGQQGAQVEQGALQAPHALSDPLGKAATTALVKAGMSPEAAGSVGGILSASPDIAMVLGGKGQIREGLESVAPAASWVKDRLNGYTGGEAAAPRTLESELAKRGGTLDQNGGRANPRAAENIALSQRISDKFVPSSAELADDVEGMRTEKNNADSMPEYVQQKDINRGELRSQGAALRQSVAPDAAPDNYGVGQEQIQHYMDHAAAVEAEKSAAYERGRSQLPPETPIMDSESLHDAISNATRWFPQDKGVVGGVLDNLQNMNGRPLTIAEHEALRTHLATVAREGDGSERAAAGAMREALETHDTLPQAGNIRDIFADARGIAARDFADQRNDPAYAAALAGKADPATFMDKFAKSPQGVQAMRQTLAGNQPAAENISAHLVDKALEAGSMQPGKTGGVSPEAMAKRMAYTRAALDAAAPGAYERLQDLQKGARMITPDPGRTMASSSNSASPILSAARGAVRQFAGRIPGVGAALDTIDTARGVMNATELRNRTMDPYRSLDYKHWPDVEPTAPYAGASTRPAEPGNPGPHYGRPLEVEEPPFDLEPPPGRVPPKGPLPGSQTEMDLPQGPGPKPAPGGAQAAVDALKGAAEAKQGGSAKSIAERIAGMRQKPPAEARPEENLSRASIREAAASQGDESLGYYLQDRGMKPSAGREKLLDQHATQAARMSGQRIPPGVEPQQWAQARAETRGLTTQHERGDIIPHDAAHYELGEPAPQGTPIKVGKPAVFRNGEPLVRGEADVASGAQSAVDTLKAPSGAKPALSYEKMIADAQRNKSINKAFADRFYQGDKVGMHSAHDMLDNVLASTKASPTADPRLSAIATVLKAVLPETRVRTALTPTVSVRGSNALGYYDPASHSITLAKDAPVQTVLHEMVHAATSKWLDANPDHAITKDLDQLRQHVLDNLNPKIRENAHLTYGLTDNHEMLAEAFTNSNFQKLMDNMSYKKTTAWGHLVNRIGRMLGIVRTSVDSTGVEYSALEHVMRATNEIMRQQAVKARGAQAAVDTLRSPSTR